MSNLLDAVRRLSEDDRSNAEGTARVVPSPLGAQSRATGSGDPEIKSMNEVAPLLELIRSDTGEQGDESGEVIYFRGECPICHHRDCLRFYSKSNSWTCYSDHNSSGYKGGTFVEYQIAAHGMTASEAVAALRTATGNERPERKVSKPGDEVEQKDDAYLLPRWAPVQAVDPPPRASVLIDGLLRRGHIGVLSGKAKVGKTWSAIELSVAVATGGMWFGRPCSRGHVLFADPEVDVASLNDRFARVCSTLGVDKSIIDESVFRWSLRGYLKANGEPPTAEDLAHDLRLAVKRGDLDPDLSLIILDSVSSFLSGDENDAKDVRRLFAYAHAMRAATGSSVVVVHHFGKSLDGDRDALSRSRGSSAWADCPDLVLTLTEVLPPNGEPGDYLMPGQRAVVLENPGNREFMGIEPVNLIWSYPVHVLDVDGLSAGWKPRSSQSKGGRKTGESNRSKSEQRATDCTLAIMSEFIVHGVPNDGLSASDAADICSERLGETVSPRTLKKYVEQSDHLDVYQKSERRWFVVPSRAPSRAPACQEKRS